MRRFPMLDSHFKKEEFKKAVKENVKMLYRKTIDEATQQQIFQAVSLAVKDVIIDNWLATQKQYEKDDPKIVYYLSMEFLMGRALGNNLINLTAYKEVKEALDELGFDLNVIEDQEPDPALGNGGLGRLAACFLDSLATLGYCAYGCGIRYHYGLFKQKIEDGYQIEVPDNWLKDPICVVALFICSSKNDIFCRITILGFFSLRSFQKPCFFNFFINFVDLFFGKFWIESNNPFFCDPELF